MRRRTPVHREDFMTGAGLGPSSAERWVSILLHDATPRRWTMWGAWASGSPERPMEFLNACQRRSTLPGSVQELMRVAETFALPFGLRKWVGDVHASEWVSALRADLSP